MELSFAAATDVGRQRSVNEDNFLVDKKLRLFLVADGMGGHAAGEVASSLAVHQIRDAISAHRETIERYRVDNPAVQPYEILQILEQAVISACAAVHDRAQQETDKRGMGTTSTLLLIAGQEQLRGFIAHVGDTRVYLTRQDQTHILTEDHSLINELVKRGKMRREDQQAPEYKKYKNAVTRAVGIYASVAVDTFDFDILPGDRLMLCSDGLHAYLPGPDLSNLAVMLSQGDIRNVPSMLVDLANDAGGHDNITAIVVRVSDNATSATFPVDQASIKLATLSRTQLFRYCTYKELVRVSNITTTVDVDAGTMVFAEGKPGESMYIVVSGKIRLKRGSHTAAELGVGEHFGELSLVDKAPRSLSAVAVERTQLLRIERSDFFEIVKHEPQAAVKMLWTLVQVLGARLRKTTNDLDEALSDAAGNDAVAELLFGDGHGA